MRPKVLNCKRHHKLIFIINDRTGFGKDACQNRDFEYMHLEMQVLVWTTLSILDAGAFWMYWGSSLLKLEFHWTLLVAHIWTSRCQLDVLLFKMWMEILNILIPIIFYLLISLVSCVQYSQQCFTEKLVSVFQISPVF